jgi:hypothetical protein
LNTPGSRPRPPPAEPSWSLILASWCNSGTILSGL